MPSPKKYLNQPMDAFLDAAIKAVEENLPANARVPIQGTQYTKPQLLAKLASLKAPYDAVTKANATVDDAIEARDEAEPEAVAFAKSYSTVMTETYGASAQVATQFAIPTPKPRRQLTVEEKMASRAKAKATRALRGTLGKRQKAKLKATGDFTVTVGNPPPEDTTTTPPVPPSVATTPAVPAPPAATTAQPAPASPGATTASNGVAAPMLMNGSGH